MHGGSLRRSGEDLGLDRAAGLARDLLETLTRAEGENPAPVLATLDWLGLERRTRGPNDAVPGGASGAARATGAPR